MFFQHINTGLREKKRDEDWRERKIKKKKKSYRIGLFGKKKNRIVVKVKGETEGRGQEDHYES